MKCKICGEKHKTSWPFVRNVWLLWNKVEKNFLKTFGCAQVVALLPKCQLIQTYASNAKTKKRHEVHHEM